jgi:REP element-mobilizing transposase RayT
MAPPHRDTTAGIFHVYTHCVWAAPAHFRDDLDRLTFLRHLARATNKMGWTCMGFCLMPTHYHLLVEVGDGVLPRAMHLINLAYSRDFNRRHGLRGHAQSGRYGSRRVNGEAHLLTTFAYIANNPVKSRAVATATDWTWSSYSGTVDLAEPHSFVDASQVIACFDGSRELGVARLRAFVEES